MLKAFLLCRKHLSFMCLESKGVPARRNIRNRFIPHCGPQWWETEKLGWVKFSPLRGQHRSAFSLSSRPTAALHLCLPLSLSLYYLPRSPFMAEMIPQHAESLGASPDHISHTNHMPLILNQWTWHRETPWEKRAYRIAN